jgi:hypothetical protein
VSGQADPALAALDAHIRAQLARAASDYESHTDLEALLARLLDAEQQSGEGAAAADS